MEGTPPAIRIEIERLRESVIHMFDQHHSALAEYTAQAIEEQLSEEWVLGMVQDSVKKAITKAIENIATNHRVSYELEKVLADQLCNMIIEGVKNDENHTEKV